MGGELSNIFKVFLLRAFVTFVFVLLFALLFQFVESFPEENDTDQHAGKRHIYLLPDSGTKQFNKVRNNTLKKLSQILNVEIDNKIFTDLYNELTRYSVAISNITTEPNKTQPWTFLKAFYFTITIVTTIGYGDVTPLTSAGKWLTIFCALLGIPVMMLMLKSLGTFIHDSMQLIIKITEHCVCKNIRVKNLQSKTFVATLFLMWSLILIGGKMEQIHSNLTLLEGIYAWFISMSTIGFGDIVVSKKYIRGSDGDRSKRNPDIRSPIAVFLFLILGLGVVASVINAVSEMLEKNKHVKQALSLCFGIGQLKGRRRASSVTVGLRDMMEGCWGNFHHRKTMTVSITNNVLQSAGHPSRERTVTLVSENDLNNR